ncbi:MAG TPA: glycine--tRNA ligase subunit alpha [Acidobacteriota bacterium]|nr:glycine--tRNA ligase subunit alpha [Acidobacteriota bacterium]HRV07059.1 glycine--tRNA ligase subunit alpha [Acidobacteriota bacterium]
MATFQDLVHQLLGFWKDYGCVIQQPYDVEVGAGTMHPETFFRVLGPRPYQVAYVQPSRRPADGRYAENPNRVYRHHQLQVILKPAPEDVQDVYLDSLRSIGIVLRSADLRFEEDNWESPTLGAWGIGWQVLLNGLEITQFTYFQQAGGRDLDPISAEITYGLERIAAFVTGKDNVFDLLWSPTVTYGTVRRREEREFSRYNFELADTPLLFQLFDLYERESNRCLEAECVLPAYDYCLKCSHTFNLLDSRGAISVTQRVALINRVRSLAVDIASAYVKQS